MTIGILCVRDIDIMRSVFEIPDMLEKVLIYIPIQTYFCFTQNHGRKEMQGKATIF